QDLDIFLSQRSERSQNHFDGFVECESSLDLRNERNVRVVVMQLGQTKDAPAKIEIAKQRFQIRANRFNQAVIHGDWHIIRKQRGFERRWIMPCSGMKHIRLHRVAKGGGERVLMVAKLSVELLESAFAQFRVALHQKRAERALAQRPLASGLV